MTTKHPPQKQHTLALPLPSNSTFHHDNISTRKLPPLPITKRKLPSLPQSKSQYVHNACSNDTPARKFHQISDSIIITPPIPPTEHKQSKEPKSIRKFLSNIQTKMTGTKTKALKNNNKISKWKPNLKFICDDEELLNGLIKFMTKQYNEENILFLQSVHKLKQNINDLLMSNANNIVKIEKIDVEMNEIYNKYITHSAQKQVNLSYHTFTNIMHLKQRIKNLSLSDKATIFDTSVNEIKMLIHNSILCSFFISQEFQSIAVSRNVFDNTYVQKDMYNNRNKIDYDSDDIDYEKDTSFQNDVCFDVNSTTQWSDHNKYMLSSKAFLPNSGSHEWKIKILKCTQEHRIEFGVISNFDANIDMNEYGICDTSQFGARAVYGYNALVKLNENKKYRGTEHNFYYASYNKDNTVRCNKDLSTLNIHQREWRKNDVIKICLNLAKSSIRFFLNGKSVRKTVSLEKNTTYYPIILYSGDCRFKIVP